MKKIYFLLIFILSMVNHFQAQVSQNTSLIGHWGTWQGRINDVVVNDSYLYIGSGNVLEVWENMKPQDACEIDRIELPDQINGMYMSDNYLYVADGPGGLIILDIRQPMHPVITGGYQLETSYSASNVIKVGKFIYLTIYQENWLVLDRCIILDISDMRNPYQVNAIESHISDLALHGNYLYVSSWFEGLEIYNVNAPYAPVLAGRVPVTDGYSTDLCLSGNTVLLGNEGNMKVIDVSDPYHPEIKGTFSTDEKLISDIVVKDNLAFLLCTPDNSDHDGSLLTCDISLPDAPAAAGECNVTGINDFGSLLRLDRGYAYAATSSGLTCISIMDPYRPVIIHSYGTSGEAMDLYAAGDYLYVAAGEKGLQVIDISNPSDPFMTGHYDTPGEAKSLVLQGDYCYVADGSAGLRIIDISHPGNPYEKGFYDTPGHASDVVVSGKYAYISDMESGLEIIDVSDPSNPVLLSSMASQYDYCKLDLQDGYLYVVSGFGGLQVIDVSQPANPQISGSYIPYYTDHGDMAVKVSGGLAYVAFGAGGVHVIDVNDPAAPYEVGYDPSIGMTADIEVLGNTIYLANEYRGLSIMDASDPGNLQLTGSYACGNTANGVFCKGGLIYVAAAENGVFILSDQAQGIQGLTEISTVQVACYPNPVSSQATISFDLKEPSHVLVEIFDNLGQKVSIPADENKSAGTQHITWNAEGNPPGIYYYRMEAGGQESSGKMIVKN